MVGCVPVQNKQGEWQGRMVGCVPVQNKHGGLCSSSEQTREIEEDGGLCCSEQTDSGGMVGCVPVQNKQEE